MIVELVKKVVEGHVQGAAQDSALRCQDTRGWPSRLFVNPLGSGNNSDQAPAGSLFPGSRTSLSISSIRDYLTHPNNSRHQPIRGLPFRLRYRIAKADLALQV